MAPNAIKNGVIVLAVLAAAGVGGYFALRGDATGRQAGSGLGKEFALDLTEHRKSPEALLAYRELTPVATAMREHISCTTISESVMGISDQKSVYPNCAPASE